MTMDPDSTADLDSAEDRLQAAVAANDAEGLALLLHDHLLATGPDGSVLTKGDDIAGYATGAFRVDSYRELRRRVLLHGDTGVTTVRAAICGAMNGHDVDVVMDYTRPGSARPAGGRC
jgi:hypothetical protein